MVEQFEVPQGKTDDERAEEAKGTSMIEKWDGVLSDLKIFSQLRRTKWLVEKPEDFSFLKRLPVELLHSMHEEKVQMHYHNWAVTREFFDSTKSLTDFWDVLAVDDGLHHGDGQAEADPFKEFVLVIQSKKHPIHAWLTHPENALANALMEVDPSKENPELYSFKGATYMKMQRP